MNEKQLKMSSPALKTPLQSLRVEVGIAAAALEAGSPGALVHALRNIGALHWDALGIIDRNMDVTKEGNPN